MECEYCGKSHDGSYGSGRFCSKSCAKGFSTKSKRKLINQKLSEKNSGKIYLGRGIQKEVNLEGIDLNRRCLYCGKLLIHSGKILSKSDLKNRLFCDSNCKIAYSYRNRVNRTLQSFVDTGQHPRVRFNGIRSHARIFLKNKGIEKKCCICGFDIVVEVHHIKPVSEFPLTATVEEVNSLSNLLYLCPNHHVMVDKGLISKEELCSYRYTE